MKRFRILSLLTILIFTLSSCTESPIDLNIDSEFTRIRELIPESYSDDLLLPQGESGYDINYKVDEVTISDNLLVFIQQKNDSYIQLQIEISTDVEVKSFYLLLTQIGNLTKYENMVKEEIVDNAISEIRTAIPDYATSNVTLPSFNIAGISVSYETNCSDMERNRIIYSYDNEEKTCILSASVSYDGFTKSIQEEFTMVALEDLPQVPAIYINTLGSSIDSDSEYTNSTLSVLDSIDLSNNLSDESIRIRLRGNSTLDVPKKSYKIKFDEKTKLLSDYAEKDWVLLANYMDQTLVRDYVAFQLAEDLQMDFNPSYQFIDLYINGVYQGNYLLTDQIEVTNDRVDIEENVSDIDTGYLIEYDLGLYREGLEESGQNYFLIDNIPFVVKSPEHDDDHYVSEQKEYISSYMEGVLYTLKMGNDYNNLIDEASFIDWYIINELFKTVDSGYSSVYFYKDKGSLLKMGPVWDFDLSSGAYGHLGSNLRGPEGWYTSRHDKNIFFYYLMKYDSFQENLKARWNELYDEVIIEVPGKVFDAADSFTYSRYQNFELWDIIGSDDQWYTSPELLILDTYDQQVWFLHDFLDARIAWLNDEINKFN